MRLHLITISEERRRELRAGGRTGEDGCLGKDITRNNDEI
jgi:hypothetical protein